MALAIAAFSYSGHESIAAVLIRDVVNSIYEKL